MPILLLRLAELDSILERPLLACRLTELLQAVLEWDQVKVCFIRVRVRVKVTGFFVRLLLLEDHTHTHTHQGEVAKLL